MGRVICIRIAALAPNRTANQEKAMKRFSAGDLAVTINSKAPLLNSGHIVRPVLEWDVPFGCPVKRPDGGRSISNICTERQVVSMNEYHG